MQIPYSYASVRLLSLSYGQDSWGLGLESACTEYDLWIALSMDTRRQITNLLEKILVRFWHHLL